MREALDVAQFWRSGVGSVADMRQLNRTANSLKTVLTS